MSRDNIHSGHRERVRQDYIRGGLEGFSDIKILEFLLHFKSPYNDTNPLAHKLKDRFGSLDGVLSADYEELMSVEGMDKNSAILISSVMQVSDRYFRSVENKKGRKLSNTEEAGKYFTELFKRLSSERFIVVCLDTTNTVVRSRFVSSGTNESVEISIRKIAETVLKLNCSSIMIGHNHPDGDLEPSEADIRSTREISGALMPLGIRVLDHIIVSGDKFFSFLDHDIPIV